MTISQLCEHFARDHLEAIELEELIDRAVASAEIVDILQAAGLESPDISILSDEFLLEVAGMEAPARR